MPEFEQRFPTFETYREQIDGKYWFPTYSYADDELNFKSGQTVHLRMRIRFTDFERLRGKVTRHRAGRRAPSPHAHAHRRRRTEGQRKAVKVDRDATASEFM